MIKRRKRRSDRNHLIYEIKRGRSIYIGVTYVEKSVTKSLARRWRKHVQRAMTEFKDWKLCEAIRRHGPEKFDVRVIAVIRGKVAAHEYERELIRTIRPSLNTDKRGA